LADLLTFRVEDRDEGLRLDSFLAAKLEASSRSMVKRWIQCDLVRVAGKEPKASFRVRSGQLIEVAPPPPASTTIAAEPLPIPIVFEDDHLLIIDKPAGMVVHPAGPRRTGTVVNALLHRYGSLPVPGAPDRPGIVHRLDKGTSGLLAVARDMTTYYGLVEQIRTRRVCREYRVVVWGNVAVKHGTISEPIARNPSNRKKMGVVYGGKTAETRFCVRRYWDVASELHVTLGTGRTHQIRVHMQWRGWPVVGDVDYGGRVSGINRLSAGLRQKGRDLLSLIDRPALHAWRLSFRHPITQEDLRFVAEPPEDYQTVVSRLDQT
jgi:23S rRNA pseudouridine1911/1915/1917 synthase